MVEYSSGMEMRVGGKGRSISKEGTKVRKKTLTNKDSKKVRKRMRNKKESKIIKKERK